MSKPLTIEECKEKDHFFLVREHGEYSFYIGLFNRYKIEKGGKIISGGTNLKLGVAKFNHWTGLESVAESMVRQSESYKP